MSMGQFTAIRRQFGHLQTIDRLGGNERPIKQVFIGLFRSDYSRKARFANNRVVVTCCIGDIWAREVYFCL